MSNIFNETIIKLTGGSGGSVDAIDVSYDNSTSGLAATNVQDAIDEVDNNVDNNTNQISVNSTEIAINQTNIGQNSVDISQNASDIAQNASDIAQNTSDIAQNASDILALQNSVELSYLYAYRTTALVYPLATQNRIIEFFNNPLLINEYNSDTLHITYDDTTSYKISFVTNGVYKVYIALVLDHGTFGIPPDWTVAFYTTDINGVPITKHDQTEVSFTYDQNRRFVTSCDMYIQMAAASYGQWFIESDVTNGAFNLRDLKGSVQFIRSV